MSTRGCVAIREEDGWKGVYNHWDSYPTGLGKELWDYLHQEDGVNLQEFAKDLLQYGDWREYLNAGVCEYCGRTAGQPCNISGAICTVVQIPEAEIRAHWEGMPWAKDNPEQVEQRIQQQVEILHNVEKTGYPDPGAKYHSHVTKDEGQIASPKNPDPLFIEWVYVVDPENRTLTILASRSDDKTQGTVREGEPILRDDGYWDYGHCAYCHSSVGEFPLDGDEPDWGAIETVIWR